MKKELTNSTSVAGNGRNDNPAMAAETRLPVFYRRPEVQRVTSLSRSEIYRRMKEGTFPKCIALSDGHVVWDEREIAAWQQKAIAGRDNANGDSRRTRSKNKKDAA